MRSAPPKESEEVNGGSPHEEYPGGLHKCSLISPWRGNQEILEKFSVLAAMRTSISLSIDRLLFGPQEYSSRARVKSNLTASADVTTKSVDPGCKDRITDHVDEISTPVSHRSEGSTPFSRWQTIWQRPYATWRPTFFHPRALSGLAALCVTIGCIFASLGILVVSDGQAVTEWHIQPTVYLAIVTAVANGALALARLEAIPVSWWYSIIRGRTIGSLERQWQTSRSVIQALAGLRHMSVLNIACIAGVLVVIDGPFLQRASTVVPAMKISSTALEITLMPELPTGFTGIVKNAKVNSPMACLNLFPEYAKNVPMQLAYSPECLGKCKAKVLGPGVAKTRCSSTTWPITYEMMHSPNATWGRWKTNDHQSALPLFSVEVARNYDQLSEAAKVTTGVAGWTNYEGSYVETVCYMVPAILEYDVHIENGTIALASDPAQAHVVRLANNTRPIDVSPAAIRTAQNDTMDGITVPVSLLTSANASAIFTLHSGQQSWTWNSETYNMEVFRHQEWFNIRGNGSLHFRDPMPGVVSKFNELFFRAATLASSGPSSIPWQPNLEAWLDPGVSVNQTVYAKEESNQNVFRSDLRWYFGAAALELVTVLLILPMYWGWWTLGCNLSMSPFSVALAFDSAILKDVNSAAGSKGVVEELASLRLKYGVVANPDGQVGSNNLKVAPVRLGVGKNEEVGKPYSGQQFWA